MSVLSSKVVTNTSVAQWFAFPFISLAFNTNRSFIIQTAVLNKKSDLLLYVYVYYIYVDAIHVLSFYMVAGHVFCPCFQVDEQLCL